MSNSLVTVLHYRAKDGNYYSRKETPAEYRRRKSPNGSDSGWGCIILFVIFALLLG